MFFIILMLFICGLVFLPPETEQPPQKPKKAVTDEARLQMKINRALQKERQVNSIKKGLIDEFYTYNPQGTPWEFNEWKERVDIEDKAHNPHRYQVTVRKPPKQKTNKSK